MWPRSSVERTSPCGGEGRRFESDRGCHKTIEENNMSEQQFYRTRKYKYEGYTLTVSQEYSDIYILKVKYKNTTNKVQNVPGAGWRVNPQHGPFNYWREWPLEKALQKAAKETIRRYKKRKSVDDELDDFFSATD